MSRTPYPGYPPSYKVVDETGGYNRTCMVVELLSLGALSPIQMTMIQEQLEAAVHKIQFQMRATIESSQVVTPDRFDPVLRSGLRLS